MYLESIMGKIFETTSSFQVKYGKNLISIFQELFASIDKILILGGRLGIRLSSCHSIQFYSFYHLVHFEIFVICPNFLRF